MAITFTPAHRALAVGGLFLVPQSAILIHRYRWWQTDFITSLEQNLTALGGPALSRRRRARSRPAARRHWSDDCPARSLLSLISRHYAV